MWLINSIDETFLSRCVWRNRSRQRLTIRHSSTMTLLDLDIEHFPMLRVCGVFFLFELFIFVSVSIILLLIFFNKFVYSLSCTSFLSFVLLSVYVVNSFSSCCSSSLGFFVNSSFDNNKKIMFFGDGHLLQLLLSFQHWRYDADTAPLQNVYDWTQSLWFYRIRTVNETAWIRS